MKKLFVLLLLFISVECQAFCPSSDFDEKFSPVSNVNYSTVYCYDQYILRYDFERKSAIWVGEHLSIGEKFLEKRTNSFRENKDIPEQFRTTLLDYKEPIYDRGHLAPSGDMISTSSQRESFLLSNMIPQVMENNRGIWKRFEEKLRVMSRTNDLIIITGPVYSAPYSFIGNNVLVPSHLFKYVYNLTTNKQFAVLIPNKKQSGNYEKFIVAKSELERVSNLKFSEGID